MERLSREYLELANSEMEKQNISNRNLIAELRVENSQLRIANNTLRIEIRKKGLS